MKILDNTGLAYFWGKIKAWCNSLFALDSAVVHKTGNETIAGTKTFSNTINGSISGNAATATDASRLKSSTPDSTAQKVVFTGGQLTRGTSAGNAYVGSSNNVQLISVPEDGTSISQTTANAQNLRFIWNGNYFSDIFVSPNNRYIWHRDVGSSTAYPWRRLVEENVAGITAPDWNISIAGSAATASAVAWSGVTSKPTTIAGYGITDAKIVNGTITLGSSSITPLTSVPSHNQASNTITAMTGYSKPSSGSAIAVSDSLNSAIGKLEAKVDAYDDSNYVHKTGDEIVAGVKNFTNATISPIFVVSSPNFTKGTLPSAIIYDSVYFGDKNARGDFKDCIGSVESALNPTTNIISTWLKVRKNVPRESSSELEDSLIGVHYNANTSEFYATAPSTLTTRNSGYDILTRDWIPKDTRIVHTTGAETISGVKTFNDNLYGNAVILKDNFIKAHPNIIKGTNPSSITYWSLWFSDKNNGNWENSCIGQFETALGTDGTVSTYMRAMKNEAGSSANCTISCIYDTANNVAKTWAPTPPPTDNTGQIATTNWVNNRYLYSDLKMANTGISISHPITYNVVPANSSFYTITHYDTNGISMGRALWWFNNSNIGGQRGFHLSIPTVNTETDRAMFGTGVSPDGTAYFWFGDHYSVHPNTDSVRLGQPATSHRWAKVYAMDTVISTSDERVKTDIDFVSEDILDAWDSINWIQFRMKDAVSEKGEHARLHTGLIAQHIDSAFKSHNLDASRYGLFCYDEWKGEEDLHDDKGNVIYKGVKAGDIYSVRYEEALCMEAAWQRRENARLKKRIADLEERLAALELKVS